MFSVFCIPGKDQVHESFIFNEWVFIFLVFIHVVQRFAGIKISTARREQQKTTPFLSFYPLPLEV